MSSGPGRCDPAEGLEGADRGMPGSGIVFLKRGGWHARREGLRWLNGQRAR